MAKNIFKALVVFTVTAALFCLSEPTDAATYEGPNGEIYMGDFLPQELADKGYVLRGAKRDAADMGDTRSERHRRDSVPRYSLPGSSWALEIPTKEFAIKDFKMSPRGEVLRMFAENRTTGVLMSVFMERAKINGNGRDARKFYWDGGKIVGNLVREDEVTKSERGELALVEYVIGEFGGMPVEQKNIYAYFAKDYIWGYIHLSKVQYTAEDKKLFDAVLDAVRLNGSFSPSSMDYFTYGTFFYLGKNYTDAALYYSKALALMDKDSSRDRKIWIITVDHLGISYGLTGDIKKAKEVFEYGISEDSTYPMFYYNLACAHAEMGNLEKALANLKKTYEYKGNMLPGEKIPDPLSDSSFAQFSGDGRFLKAVKEYRGR